MPQPKSNAGPSARKPSGAAAKKRSSSSAAKPSAAKPSAGARRPSRARPAAKPAPAAEAGGVLELLAKGLVLTADRIQEAMDDAVRRGRMTRDDAEQLVAALVDAGRKQTGELLHDLEALVERSRDVAGGARGRVGDRLLREGDRARRVAGLGAFPISRYDDLTAAQITARLGDLSPAQLRKVRDYERRHGNRKSVLRAIEKRLG